MTTATLLPEFKIKVNEEIKGDGWVLRFGPDGNLVLYSTLVPGWVLWAWGTSHPNPGWAKFQHDGNLLACDRDDMPYAATMTVLANPVMQINTETGMKIGGQVFQTVWESGVDPAPPVDPVEPPVSFVKQLVGYVRQVGRSFGDSTGPRIVHGCTDFGGMKKFRDDRDASLRSLDVIAAHQQYVRAAWRLNGGLWTDSGLTIDPIRDSWYDETVRGFFQACHERGLRVMACCADMNNWSYAQMDEGIQRVAQIAASVSNTVVWLHEWNELRSIWHPGDENEEQIQKLCRMSEIWQQHYPWSMRGLSDPFTQDKAGMKKLSRSPANCALLHNVRWSEEDAIRRAFNAMYENYPDLCVAENEPTGPNGSPPHGPFTRHVYQPTEDHDALLAIYTMHVITGQSSTYFNDPALYSRLPLDSTWGFKEIPALWRLMEIPEHIGQGTLRAGHNPEAPLRVNGSHALRTDGMVLGDYKIGVISGSDGQGDWKVPVGYSGTATAYRASGVVWEGRVSAGQVLPLSGPRPTVVRIVP